MGSVCDDFISDHARKALISARTKVIGWFHNGMLTGAVELCWSTDRIAEAAFSIEPLHRKQGVGTALAIRAIRAARNRGFAQIMILTEVDNVAMRRLGARFGARLVVEGREVEGTVATGTTNMLSVIFEIGEEQRALIRTALPVLPRNWPAPA